MTQAPQATATMTQRGSPVAVIGHLCLEFGFDTLADPAGMAALPIDLCLN